MRRIAAMGGGGFSMEPRNPRLDRWLLSLTGKRRPRVLFVPTASGDWAGYIARFHRAFAKHACEPSHLQLFDRTVRNLRDFVLRQHIVYVGGGSTANMLAVWRLHGLDAILREAWENGTLLCGVSAGANCWFESSLTDSFGRPLRPLRDGLALLAGSFCPTAASSAAASSRAGGRRRTAWRCCSMARDSPRPSPHVRANARTASPPRASSPSTFTPCSSRSSPCPCRSSSRSNTRACTTRCSRGSCRTAPCSR